jgi:integrase
MTKGDAREAVGKIVAAIREVASETALGNFVERVYFPFFSRKWKSSTRAKTVCRIRVQVLGAFRERELSSFRRDGLQDFLDEKAKTLSFSVVNHLRWDLKQIFEMAVAEGLVNRNPALLLFAPRHARKPVRKVMTVEQTACVLASLAPRDRLIAKFALLAGMRPGEIFALRWGRIGDSCAEVVERVYEGVLDSPKTDHSVRKVALPSGVIADLKLWRRQCRSTRPEAFVFASETGTPLSKHNVWQRNMRPRLKKAGLEWCTFQVMRRSHSTLMKAIKADPKLVADQMGHTLDVNQNVYTQSPVELRLPLVNELEKLVA